MAEVGQREWKLPGQRSKRLAWGFTVTIGGKRVRQYRSEWSKDDAERELAKVKKKSVKDDERHLGMFVAAFGKDTPLTEVTTAKINAWKSKRLAAISPQ